MDAPATKKYITGVNTIESTESWSNEHTVHTARTHAGTVSCRQARGMEAVLSGRTNHLERVFV
jgi:hypothetical protein